MEVTKRQFGTYKDEPVYLYTIENNQKTKISVLTYAATWQNFEVNENGVDHSLISHFDNLDDYIKTPYQVGKTVGRVAGRIGNASFKIDDKFYKLPPNDGENLIHGGSNGFQNFNFTSTVIDNKVVLTHKFLSADDGFPGDLSLKITYSLSPENEVKISYSAINTEKTLFNPTCHVYFNVTDSEDVFGQGVKINSKSMLAVDSSKVPTGEILPLTSGYDFKKFKTISKALDDLKSDNGKLEFDDTFVTDENFVATIKSNKRAVDFSSDRNGLVIFTANPNDPKKADERQYNSLAMEMQTLPDAINHSGFGNIILPRGKEVTYTNSYKYRQIN
ncbi:aldose 1-epimerase [Companilactobacillus tucceti DSM 20183]|uniref:Aldose 1-epimerase n=1 Tax=Companilactobacillus tucceti DSM 20183 TaxID=1423811 RepID=A0A0R1J311_9LACO|nr:aldose epimerase family protein [Companilactobacillus tucceti]KRK65789.1 aldose 1-epimerase [Companilactobacillus tucceti DSM 20183]